MRLNDMTQSQQLEHLVSKRDRAVSIYLQTGNPAYRDGRELIATITVTADPDGSISLGLSQASAGGPSPEIEVEFIDDDSTTDITQ